MLLGAYDSDNSGSDGEAPAPAVTASSTASPAASQKPAPAAVVKAASASAVPPAAVSPLGKLNESAPLAGPGGRHGPFCDCEDCQSLLARFVAKNVQTKGIRFKCKLCGEMFSKKADAAEHMQVEHAKELQAFKMQKQPSLFEAPKKVAVAAAKKISFRREDVLGKKRKMDDEGVSFGGWEKKEKPEPPPCEQAGYHEMMQADVIVAPPWMNQPVPLSNDTEATDTEKVVDQHVVNAQAKRFTSRNVLEVKKDVVRCKLCYKTFTSAAECEKHIIEAHQDEFKKEQGIWHRFLFTMSKRQPPFGWVCKVCNVFFPTDNAVWRHLGKEVFIRREQKHSDLWKEKEDRWGHDEDQECNGDGMNFARGFSMESVKMFQDGAAKEKEQEDRAAAAAAGFKDAESSSDDDNAAPDATSKKSITEF